MDLNFDSLFLGLIISILVAILGMIFNNNKSDIHLSIHKNQDKVIKWLNFN